MAFPLIGSLNRWQRGFFSILLFYAVGLGSAVVLSQFMPVADMCNPGLPFITLLITVGLGVVAAAFTFIAYVARFRSHYLEGMLVAHLMALLALRVAFLYSISRGG